MKEIDYKNPDFLLSHIRSIINFYYPVCMDYESGGYHNQLLDDGTIYDHHTKHLVGTCRFIYNFSIASILFADQKYKSAAQHGIEFLTRHHRQANGGYAWILNKQAVQDGSFHCYGHAFVVLALAGATKAGIGGASTFLEETWNLLEERFWEGDKQLYVDEINSNDWKAISPYRGQNANMHMCEAMLSAYEATKEIKYLDRASKLAYMICVKLSDKTDGLIWEHYQTDWTHDWNFNLDDPKNLFKPYGYLPGHFTEWSKLLLILNRYRSEEWQTIQAEKLFQNAIGTAWDDQRKAMNYTFSPDREILDTDGYYWVYAETIAASALLALKTGNSKYWDSYNLFWDCAQKDFVDHRYGGWYRILDENGRKYSDQKSPASKTDYHPLAACYEVLTALKSYSYNQL